MRKKIGMRSSGSGEMLSGYMSKKRCMIQITSRYSKER
jgi:hypothetical protein